MKTEQISAQIKIVGDEYAGFYSCGLTMQDSESMRRMEKISETEEETVLLDDRKVEIRVRRKRMEVDVSEYGNNPKNYSEELPIRVQTTVTNHGEQDVTLEMASSFSVSDIPGDRLYRLRSFWSAEGRLQVDDTKSLDLECSWNKMAYRVEKFGNLGTMPVRSYFPFLAIEDSTTGRFTAIQLYSPCSWQMEVICRESDLLTVAGGIADRDFGAFSKVLKPGASLTTPEAVLAEGFSLEEVCDKLIKAQRPNISPVDDRMGIVFNEYCTTWGSPTEENMKKICDAIAGKGIQYLVMDAGWFGPEDGYWWENTGDWSVNYSRFPNGLRPVAEYIREKGMIPGIWYEFENLGTKSPLYQEAEHVLYKDGRPLSVGGRRTLDMQDPFVKEHLKKDVIDLMKDCGFGYIKVDYNDTFGNGCDGPDGPGENLRQNILGTQEFFRRMRAEIPDLVIENCSSGGHRLEPSMMELSSMASFSDAHEILSLPIIAANLHRAILPSQSQIWAVIRSSDSDARIFYSICATFLGRMGLSGDIYDLTEHQWKLVDDGMAFYREVSEIIAKGYTCINVCDAESYNAPAGGQIVARRLGDRTLVIYHRFADSLDRNAFLAKHDLINAGIAPEKAVLTYGHAENDFSAMAWIV